jgi:GT2 family glycosyltransferase
VIVSPRLSIVIPSHNRVDLLSACLSSVVRHAPPDTQIIVVDDASPGAVVSAAASRFPNVETIRREVQGGFCVAVNRGIAAARHPIVELLNDDTEVCSGWADAALTAFADESIAAVAPLVLCHSENGIVDSAGDDYHLAGIARKRGHNERFGASHQKGCFVFGASGSSAFYRREVLLRVGAFPESFGAYFEDVDLSFRLQRAGYRIWYEPASRVLHHVSASYGQRPDPANLQRQSRNEELVYWRNLPSRQLAASLPLHLLVLIGKALRRLRHGELMPYLLGRLEAFSMLPEVLRYRRRNGC